MTDKEIAEAEGAAESTIASWRCRHKLPRKQDPDIYLQLPHGTRFKSRPVCGSAAVLRRPVDGGGWVPGEEGCRRVYARVAQAGEGREGGDMKTCGTCGRWVPAVKRQVGKDEYTAVDAGCPWFKWKMADSKPESWCWTQASEAQIKSRVRAGLINE